MKHVWIFILAMSSVFVASATPANAKENPPSKARVEQLINDHQKVQDFQDDGWTVSFKKVYLQPVAGGSTLFIIWDGRATRAGSPAYTYNVEETIVIDPNSFGITMDRFIVFSPMQAYVCEDGSIPDDEHICKDGRYGIYPR